MLMKLLQSVIGPYKRSALLLGLTEDDLWSTANSAAMDAQASWCGDGSERRAWVPGQTQGARSLESWIWLRVDGVLRHMLGRAGRALATEESWEDGPDHRPDVETQVMVREALGYLQAQLAPDDWRLLWLFHAEEVPQRQIAVMMGITHAAVRTRLSRARNRAVTILG